MAAGQTQFQGGPKPGDEEGNFEAGQTQIQATGVDELLDEIDGLLEHNAEEFVRSYVQKGGE